MNPQLNLFTQDIFYEDEVFTRANELLALLNDGLKPKECWQAEHIIQYEQYYILSAVRKNPKTQVWNVLDDHGNIPEGFEVNWRIFPHILNNLKINHNESITTA